jgi:hypothetical protein
MIKWTRPYLFFNSFPWEYLKEEVIIIYNHKNVVISEEGNFEVQTNEVIIADQTGTMRNKKFGLCGS